MQNAEFFNLYNHGLIRVAVGIPELQVADPAFNASRTMELMEQAEREKAILALFPELGLSAYSCDDLFHQQALLDGSLDALRMILKASESRAARFSESFPRRSCPITGSITSTDSLLRQLQLAVPKLKSSTTPAFRLGRTCYSRPTGSASLRSA